MSVQLNEGNFKSEVLDSAVPVLVDFWATWCGPCQMMCPVVEEISGELGDKIKVGKVNVDENSELTEQYDVMSIPTFILFKGGKVAGQVTGAVGKEKLLSLINA